MDTCIVLIASWDRSISFVVIVDRTQDVCTCRIKTDRSNELEFNIKKIIVYEAVGKIQWKLYLCNSTCIDHTRISDKYHNIVFHDVMCHYVDLVRSLTGHLMTTGVVILASCVLARWCH